MVRKNLMVMFASLLFVLGALLAPGFFSSTAHANSTVATSSSDNCPTLRYYDGYNNSKTDRHNVAILQTRLFSWLPKHDKNFDYSNTTVVDGYFGPGTLALVEEVQYKSFGDHNKDPKKQIDGIVGPNTWSALGGCTVPSDEVLPQGL